MMKLLKWGWIAAGLYYFTLSQASIPHATTSMAPMLAKSTPSVVNITARKVKLPVEELEIPQTKPLPVQKSLSLGSGVIFDAHDGLIVTNAHVVKNADIIIVTLKDSHRYRAKLINEDDGFDIAVIQIQAPNLIPIHWADSDKLKVGDFVAAIGSPFGFTQSVTSGVVSALNRVTPQIEGFQSFIQTDAPINPGNSGGALVNMDGELVGINTAIFSTDYGSVGIGFAIPSNMVHSVIEQLLKYGKVKRGMLGVVVQNITPELAEALSLKMQEGAIVTQILPGTPAAKDDIKVGDVVEKINDHLIFSASQVRNMLGLMRPGSAITLTLLRHHTALTVSTTIGDPTAPIHEKLTPFINGLRMQDFNELDDHGQQVQGILVTGVSETSDAALAGLLPGDVITKANGVVVHHFDELKALALKNTKHLLLEVSRQGQVLFLVIN